MRPKAGTHQSRFHLSPSRLARYFYHDCDRYLRYVATPHERRRGEGIPTQAHDASPVAAQLLEGGYRWEQEVVTRHLRGKVEVARGTGLLHERTHSAEQTIALLKGSARKAKGKSTVYQPTLMPAAATLERYGLDPELVELRQCRPDLLELDSERIRVVDLKASDELKTSHRIQVALYALLLRDILAEAKLAREVDLTEGGVWLYGHPEPVRFDMGLTTGIVEAFLRDRLPAILSAPLPDVAWHLYFRCEWCDYFDSCRKEAERTRSVSLLPYLSVGARRYLHEAPWGGEPVETLADMRALLERDDAPLLLDGCGSLRGRRDRLAHAVEALEQGNVVAHGGSTAIFPVFEQVQLVISLEREPVSGGLYAVGFRRFRGKEVFGSVHRELVLVARSEGDCARIGRELILALYEELSVLHEYNAKRAWREQQSLQTYVFDSYEERLYTELLLGALDDPELAPYALALLLHYQGPELASTDEQPGVEVPYPVVVLTSVLRELFALPAPLAIKLDTALRALPSPNFDFKYNPSDLFAFELSNALKSDAIFLAWHGRRPEATEWVEKEIRRRLVATGTLIDGIRAAAKERLFAWPPKFALPLAASFAHHELSKVAFVVRYESFMAACANRQLRSKPWEERVRDGISVPLRFLGGERWAVESEIDESVVETFMGFRNGILVPASPEGDRDQMAYDDYRNRRTLWAPSSSVRLCEVKEYEADSTGGVGSVTLEVFSSTNQPEIRRGAKMVLQARVTDFISDNVVKRLEAIDEHPDAPLIALIREPAAYDTKAKASSTTKGARKSAAAEAEKGVSFTPSQRVAFEHMLDRTLTLVWGPPGTGKTHFLARAIRHLAAGAARAGRPLHVAVTAFTHAAIDNLLREIADCSVPGADALGVIKLDGSRTPRGEGLEELGPKLLGTLDPEASWVVGGTVHALRKGYAEASPNFDLLVVDEGSQMKIGEFALATLALGASTRLVIAGDDLQLPPIIQGTYPEPEDGRRGLQDSIFAYLRDRDDGPEPFTCQLLENWRMNDLLTRFSSESLYGEGYVPATEAIADRRLRLAPPTIAKGQASADFVDWMLDPAHPLVVGVLEGVQAATQNRVEAGIVAAVAARLRSRLLAANGKRYPDSADGDRAFWTHGLFIVSPHHDQIRAIRRALSNEREWHHAPFVDTVDKMQGQQSEAVIVSYGVSDPETALSEDEFIYSLNRLNVSVTRARSKCMVFLPRPLLEPSFEVISNDDAARGLGHMLRLVEFCRAGEERRVGAGEMGAEEGVGMGMWRVG